MSIPHYINDDKSDMRGIKPGWYAMEDNGKLSSGPFSSRHECLSRDTQPMNGSTPSNVRQRPNCSDSLLIRAGSAVTGRSVDRHQRPPSGQDGP
jgi:hypothetical protein